MLQPTRLISTPFAQEGEKTEIQNVTGEFDNSATYRLGFPPLTMQSIRLGGKPPKGTDFNGVLFDITENISFLCKGGRYQYNAGLSTLIGGYPEGSSLLLDDNVTEVVSTVAGNQNNPNIDMTGWILKPNKTTAVNVADASGETQQQVNYNGGSKWHSRVGGYLENERTVLDNGDIVKSTVDGNTNDPNVDMTGWVFANYDTYSPNAITLQNNIKGDGVSNDSIGLNSLADDVDLNKKDKIKFPSYNNNYHLESTVVIQEPTGLIGDKPATYDRGLGKDGGWFLLGNNVGTAFDLGNNRTYSTVYDKAQKTSPNPADFWTIKNIGIKTDVGVPRRTQNGISFTNQHNGAERGVYISEVSMKDLDKCIHIAEQENPNYWVTVATLNINNSVLTGSNYGVYAEGRSYQTAIEGNQIEQNYEASIYGNFDGPFRAVNNIIEGFGQKAGIVFKAVQKAGNNPATQAIIESHYFEGLQDSCIDISGNRECAYWIRGNKNFGTKTKDYCIVRKGSVTRVFNEEQTYITLEDGAYLSLNSILTRNNIYGFYTRPTSNMYDNSSVAHKLDSLSPPIPSQVTVNAGFTKTIANVRDQLCYVMTAQETFPAAPVTFAEGDLLEISVLSYCDSAGNGLGINGVIGNGLVASFGLQSVEKEWLTTTVVARCAISGSNITFIPQFNTTTGTGFKIAGITVRNLGGYVAGEKYLVRPTQPTLHTIGGKHAQKFDYAGGTVLANGGTRKFDLVVSKYGFVGELVQAALSVYVPDLEVSAVVRSGGVVQVTLKNPTTADIVVPACQVRVVLL